MALALTNCLFPSNGQFIEANIIINENKIDSIVPTHGLPDDIEKIDLYKNYVIPGLVDLQINGGGGVYFTKDISEPCLEKIYLAHLKHGTTWWLPTLITTNTDNILKAIEVVGKCITDNKYGILGMHLEGPYMNPVKKGAHNPSIIRKPTDKELNIILEAGEGIIKMMTLAPELFTDNQLKAITDAEIIISAGHSNATCKESIHAFSKGVRSVTHLFNAMSQFDSRNPGLVGATLDSENVWAGIIVDGVHCDYTSVKLAYKLKREKLFLVSDASFIDAPVKEFEFDALKIQYKNGQYYTPDGNLAGSSIAMLDGLRNCVEHVQIPLPEAINMATLYPAELLGMSGKIGKVKLDYSSNLTILNKELDIEGVVTSGKVQFFNRK